MRDEPVAMETFTHAQADKATSDPGDAAPTMYGLNE